VPGAADTSMSAVAPVRDGSTTVNRTVTQPARIPEDPGPSPMVNITVP
ncbi:MAG: hypothetical protein QG622_2197, partial [Actinomycetota bacterium]|nr:hypothetical protein [Actinomycetota bacterium]